MTTWRMKGRREYLARRGSLEKWGVKERLRGDNQLRIEWELQHRRNLRGARKRSFKRIVPDGRRGVMGNRRLKFSEEKGYAREPEKESINGQSL